MSARMGWVVAAAALVVGLAVTYPLVWHLGVAIPYGVGVSPDRRFQDLVAGDHLQLYYYLSLVPRSAAGEIPWLRDPLQFATPEPSARATFFFLPFSLVFALLSPLGNIVAYNVFVLASFPATALATFALARRWGLEMAGASLAAAAATLLPYRLASLASGHPAGFVLFLVPAVFAALERAWWRESRGAAATAAALMLCLAWNEPHYLYFLGFLLPIWLVAAAFRMGSWSRDQAPLGDALPRLALAALGPTIAYGAYVLRRDETVSVVDAVLIWVVMTSTVALAWRLAVEARVRAGDREIAVSEATSFLPLLGLAFYPLQSWFDLPYGGRILAFAFLGLLAVAKRPFFTALVRLARGEAGRELARRLLALWPLALGLVVVAAFVLQFKASVATSPSSLGRSRRDLLLFSSLPRDFLARSSVNLTHQLYPGAVVVALAAAGLASPAGRWLVAITTLFAALALGIRAPVWLPYYPAALLAVPFLTMIRQTGRFFVIGSLLLAFAGGLGLDQLTRRLGGARSAAAAGVALVLVAIDFSSMLPIGLTRLPEENRAYAIVAKEARGTNLLELPIWPGDSAFSSIYQYWTTRTAVPIVNGYSPTHGRDYVERVFRVLEPLNVGDLTKAIDRRLDELRVRFVTLHADAFPAQVSIFGYRRTLEALRADPNLEERALDGGTTLFERRDGEFRDHATRIGWPIGTFFEAEALLVNSGTKEDDAAASGGRIVRGFRRKGPSIFGPFRSFPPGAYSARFRVRGNGVVEVTTNSGRIVLGREKIDADRWIVVTIPFGLDQTRPVELRTWADGGRTIEADWVLASSADPGADAKRIEGERLTIVGGFDRDGIEDASGAAYAFVGAPPGAIARDGPYRWMPAGRLELAVRSRGAPLQVRLESADGRRRFGEVPIEARASWGVTTATIEIPEDVVLCTRIVAVAPESADLDYIELTPRTAS